MSNEVRVRVYKIVGRITDPKMKVKFSEEIRAVKPEDAIEKIYAEFGSRHKLKRHHIRIISVEPIEEK